VVFKLNPRAPGVLYHVEFSGPVDTVHRQMLGFGRVSSVSRVRIGGGSRGQGPWPPQIHDNFFGWCYFPSVGTEIKCNNSIFSVRMDGNLYAYIRYFPSVGTENYS